MKVRATILAACAVLVFAVSAFAGTHRAETVTPKFDRAIPNILGKSLVVVEVDYPPGASSAPHKHAKSAFVYAYVISGEIELEVNASGAHIYRAGESWSELPNARHLISRNASRTTPAKLLAVFVVDFER